MDAGDYIREHCTGDVTTALVHHSALWAQMKKEMSQAAARGATDLADGLRWVMVVQGIDKKLAQDLQIPEQEKRRYRQCAIPKANYEQTSDGDYLKWMDGVFVHVPLQSQRARTEAERHQDAMPTAWR